jgi:hypothetical protein
MQSGQGETYQPNGYLSNTRPREVEMRSYNQPESSTPAQENKPEETSRFKELVKDEEPSMKGYLLHWVAFLIVLGVYIGVWAVDYFAIKRQYSYYYSNFVTVSTYVDAVLYSDSRAMFGTNDPTDTLAIAMSLIYSWALWKLPLCLYALHLTAEQPSKAIRIGTIVAEVLLLLAADILLTVFVKQYYGDWIFYGIYIVLTLIVALANNVSLGRGK